MSDNNHAKFFENVIDNIIKPIGEELEGKIDSASPGEKSAIITDIERSHYQIDYAAQLTTTDNTDDKNIYIQDANINITKKNEAIKSGTFGEDNQFLSLSALITSFSNITITDKGIESFQQKIKGGGKSLKIKFSILFNFKVKGKKVIVEKFYRKDTIFEVSNFNDEEINKDKSFSHVFMILLSLPSIPNPILITIFSSLGTCIMFFTPKLSFNWGSISDL